MADRTLCPIRMAKGQTVPRLGKHEGNQTIWFLGGHWPPLQQEFKDSMLQKRKSGASVFIALMALAALGCFALALAHWQSSDPVKFACYLGAALLASSLKVSLPSIEGTLSVNFLFTLLGILELSLPETLLIRLASTLAQFYWRPARHPKFIQLVFNVWQVPVSSPAACVANHLGPIHFLHMPELL